MAGRDAATNKADYMTSLAALQKSLPPDLQALIADVAWHENQIGWSGVRVFRLTAPDGSARYLKIAEPPHDLTPEMQRLEWLQGRLPVPQLLYFADTFTHQYLLMSEISGLVAFHDHFKDQRGRIIELLAEGLRQIHSVPVTDCPFDNQIAALIKRARLNIFEGRVSDKIEGRSPHEVLAEVLATRPDEENLVFTHGDYCLPNVLIDPDSLTINGYIDWGQGGIADPYYDLTQVVRSIVYNFGEDWVAPFWEAFGVAEIDQDKLAFFRKLDDLLWIV
ncbi:MAG: aminoglycoside 3'-phosphotransferase [Anaerolineae bacterium]|nr:aminoglycoside 3'-phosphotransferase [Anaerolineae bacterium]